MNQPIFLTNKYVMFLFFWVFCCFSCRINKLIDEHKEKGLIFQVFLWDLTLCLWNCARHRVGYSVFCNSQTANLIANLMGFTNNNTSKEYFVCCSFPNCFALSHFAFLAFVVFFNYVPKHKSSTVSKLMNSLLFQSIEELVSWYNYYFPLLVLSLTAITVSIDRSKFLFQPNDLGKMGTYQW